MKFFTVFNSAIESGGVDNFNWRFDGFINLLYWNISGHVPDYTRSRGFKIRYKGFEVMSGKNVVCFYEIVGCNV